MNRYARQSLFHEVGPERQARLQHQTIAVVGIGALGCQIAAIVARAGIGHLRLIDRDLVERTNLQRQILFTEQDAIDDAPKASAARRHLVAANGEIEIVAHDRHLDAANVEELLTGADVILDGSDNFEVRYLINDFAVRGGIPWVYAAAVGSSGLLMPVLPGETPCLRCLFEEPPPAGSAETCDTTGVLGSTTSTVGSLAALEGLKIAFGRRDAVRRGLLQLDVWSNEIRAIHGSTPRDDCPCCAERQFPFVDAVGAATTSLCGRDAVQIAPPRGGFDFDLVRHRLSAATHGEDKNLLFRFEVDGRQVTLFRDGRAIIRGTDDEAVARRLYDRYIGS